MQRLISKEFQARERFSQLGQGYRVIPLLGAARPAVHLDRHFALPRFSRESFALLLLIRATVNTDS